MKAYSAALLGLMITLQAHGAIFGQDNRVDITPNSPSESYARSTAIAVLSGNFKIAADKIKLDFSDESGILCKDQRFSDQPSLSYACTGFLVAPNILATAGHCMVNTGESEHETDTYCKAFSWLFDYQVDSSGKFNAENISTHQLYHCKQVIYAVNQSSAPFLDFALVELDRPAIGRKPFTLAPAMENQIPLSMIGYPLGMPAKYSTTAKILLDNPSRESFITNLDAFEGNSGSPVLNRSMEVVGILIAGSPSPNTIDDASGTCGRYNRCDENGENCLASDAAVLSQPGFQHIGSEVQRIAPLQDKLRSFEKARKTNPSTR
jgi:V8-like Glu-specific endopeptidase